MTCKYTKIPTNIANAIKKTNILKKNTTKMFHNYTLLYQFSNQTLFTDAIYYNY